MTFLELQKKIVQTRKARKGIHHSEDYYIDGYGEEIDLAIYRKALAIANQTVKYLKDNELSPSEIAKTKIAITVKGK